MRDRRLLIGLGVIVALVGLFLVFRPGDDNEEGTGTTTTAVTAPPTLEPTATETETATTAAPPEGTQLVVTIRDGEPAGGIVRVTVHKGDLVLIKVRSDGVADEVHVHGYDRMADVAPGKPVEMLLRANLTGRFEIELEGRGKQIAQLTVLP
jgi:hypothetical protein